jgi:nucleoside-diphosphate-sugar epimerase
MRRVLITGASGFVASALIPELQSRGWQVRGATRRPDGRLRIETIPVGDIGRRTNWSAALDGVDAVVHLAAHVHRRGEGPDDDARHFTVNAEGTARLAETAAASGVRRIVFVSSIKAVADDGLVTDDTPPLPRTAYGRSKLEGEQTLERIADQTGIETVILRPPLVYGPGVGANFLQLLRICHRGLPLPLGAIRNQRSLIYVGNLADAIATCLSHPLAAGHRFLLHDGPTPSTPGLISKLRAALGQPPRLIAVQPDLLRAGLRLLGQSDAYQRLAGSLLLDDAGFRTLTGWSPPMPQDQALLATACWFAQRSFGPGSRRG